MSYQSAIQIIAKDLSAELDLPIIYDNSLDSIKGTPRLTLVESEVNSLLEVDSQNDDEYNLTLDLNLTLNADNIIASRHTVNNVILYLNKRKDGLFRDTAKAGISDDELSIFRIDSVNLTSVTRQPKLILYVIQISITIYLVSADIPENEKDDFRETLTPLVNWPIGTPRLILDPSISTDDYQEEIPNC